MLKSRSRALWFVLSQVNTKKEALIILEAQYRPSQDAIVVEVINTHVDRKEQINTLSANKHA